MEGVDPDAGVDCVRAPSVSWPRLGVALLPAKEVPILDPGLDLRWSLTIQLHLLGLAHPSEAYSFRRCTRGSSVSSAMYSLSAYQGRGATHFIVGRLSVTQDRPRGGAPFLSHDVPLLDEDTEVK
jgi:hypothetical protein